MSHEKYSPEPPGFALHQSRVTDGRDTALVELYLPAQLKSALDLQKKQELEQRIAEAQEEEQRELEERRARRKNEDQSFLNKDRAGVSAPLAPTPLPPLVADEDYDPRLMHPVYAADAPSRLFAKAALATPDKEIRKRDEELGRTLTGRGILRNIAAPENAFESLAALRQSQPHFGEVIDLVRDQLMLATRTRRGPRIPPMLLDGEPGLGKTHFAIELAKALGTTVRRISFDSAISGATLMGSERRWGNTQYGMLFELVCLGEHANPIVILDEIDKAETRREWDPLAPLHTLLEPSTAAQVRDISADFEFDASMVTWIATSNVKFRLAPSLRSRFREFHIARPDAAHAIDLARAVVSKVTDDLALTDFEQPDKGVAVSLAHLTAREIRQAMEQAIASAVGHGRRHVTSEDLPADVRGGNDAHDADSAGPAALRKRKAWLH